ncbi:MAG: PDZ domain-containing protein [Akkermansiaceae bacterium]|nr:PDZ domain-containing protein [Akkermansiaceae bacterium]
MLASILVAAFQLEALELPAGLVVGLQSEKYAEREKAEAELLAWGRQRPEEAMEEFYKQSREAAEPEVRERCHAVLREIVGDEYLRDGVGYLGVMMNQMIEPVRVAGEAELRFGIRLTQVVADTPAKKAGLVVGDVLLGVNDRMWGKDESPDVVTKVIKGFKAGAKVTVSLFREGKVVVIPLVLGRRPAIVDIPMLLGFGGGLGQMPEPAAVKQAEEAAKEEHFRQWLARKLEEKE